MGSSETRWHGSGETSSKGFIYYWSGMRNDHHVKGIAIGIYTRLQPSAVEVDEHTLRLRLKDSLGFMSIVTLSAPIET